MGRKILREGGKNRESLAECMRDGPGIEKLGLYFAGRTKTSIGGASEA